MRNRAGRRRSSAPLIRRVAQMATSSPSSPATAGEKDYYEKLRGRGVSLRLAGGGGGGRRAARAEAEAEGGAVLRCRRECVAAAASCVIHNPHNLVTRPAAGCHGRPIIIDETITPPLCLRPSTGDQAHAGRPAVWEIVRVARLDSAGTVRYIRYSNPVPGYEQKIEPCMPW